MDDPNEKYTGEQLLQFFDSGDYCQDIGKLTFDEIHEHVDKLAVCLAYFKDLHSIESHEVQELKLSLANLQKESVNAQTALKQENILLKAQIAKLKSGANNRYVNTNK